MDDLTLMCHMAGGGEAVAGRLRERGVVDLTAILEKSPDGLAEECDIDRAVAAKIITAARVMRKVETPRRHNGRMSTQHMALAAAEQAISTAIDRAPKKQHVPVKKGSVKRSQRPRYGRLLFPILALALIGITLRYRG